MSVVIRSADPARDAAAVAEIYRPAVETSIASFEAVPPDAAEMASRMRKVQARTPWLVASEGDTVIGYAYAALHKERHGYRWSVDISVYIGEGFQGRRIGRRLYDELLALLRRQGFVNVYAGIALPNAPSIALHESLGMRRVAVYERVGFKFGAWRDVAWYGMRIAEPEGDPAEPTWFPDLGS